MNRPAPWVRSITDVDVKQAAAIFEETPHDLTYEADLDSILHDSECKVLVSGHYLRVDGFLVYQEFEGTVEIIHMAVAGDCARRGVGTALLRCALEIMPEHPFEAWVRETNLAAQLFLRKSGFQCVEILRDAYPCSGDSAYLFCLDDEGEAEWYGVRSEFKLKKAR